MFLRKILGLAVFVKECGNQAEGLNWEGGKENWQIKPLGLAVNCPSAGNNVK